MTAYPAEGLWLHAPNSPALTLFCDTQCGSSSTEQWGTVFYRAGDRSGRLNGPALVLSLLACALTLQSCSEADKSSKLTLLRQLVQANSCSVADVAISHTKCLYLGLCCNLVNLGSKEAVLIDLNQVLNAKGKGRTSNPRIGVHSGGDSSN